MWLVLVVITAPKILDPEQNEILETSRMTEKPIFPVTILNNTTDLFPQCVFLEYIKFVVSLLGQF